MINDTFILESDDGDISCKVITTLYSESRDRHYLVYESENEPDNIFVSIMNFHDGDLDLDDIESEEELKEITALLEME